MKRILLTAVTAASMLPLHSEELPVNGMKVAGPYTTAAAIQVDSVDATGNAYQFDEILRDGIVPQAWKKGQDANMVTDKDGKPAITLSATEKPAVFVAGFTLDNTHFAKCKVKANGAPSHIIYIDNKQGSDQNLTPGRHEIVVKVLCKANETDTLSVSLESEQSAFITINADGKRPYALSDYMNGEKASTTALSASGRYLMLNSYMTGTDTKQVWKREIIDLKTGNTTVVNDYKEWASEGDRYISERRGVDGENIYEYVDPATMKREPLFIDYGKNRGSFLPGEKEMIVNKTIEGPKEDAQVHQVLEPDDRQPGWRNRNNVQLLDVTTGQLTRLTVGHHNSYATLSRDNRQVLISTTEDCLTEWPFSFRNVYLYNRDTQQIDTLVSHSGFLGSVAFMPDGKSVVFSGSPEAFGGIGKNDPTGKTASLIQTELFIMDLATKQVKSLTYDFNPNVSSFQISSVDNCIYALCENRDRHDIFRIDPKTEKITQLKLTECYVKSFSLSENKAMLSYTGQSDSNADRVYTVDLKNGKETLIRDYNVQRMGDIALGKCEDWYFKSSRGDSICGRYYLPANFDANKKYPMLVYYYGGCSPTGRYLESYYNFHGWAAMSYVVYVIQPSGCTGFGQEFAARHVNTYGEGTAEDIIEGTLQFCREHPFVNKDKIGCLGASYGGFMTQYLMTKTDIFAASMSHAGISNPTSYWGYGYWGYSYSAISAANSYPWNNEKLLSGQAPLFNADKVHTPILFLHGAADTNVPINESIQMFTALKILGRECAFVTVEGQDHHITDYEKQIKWVNTYYAWFAKWLQDDPTWWNTLYPEKKL